MKDTPRTPKTSNAEPMAINERTQRVLELRRQIRAGTYRTDPQAIAAAMMAHWLVAADAVPAAADNPLEFAGRFLVEPTAIEPGAAGASLSA